MTRLLLLTVATGLQAKGAAECVDGPVALVRRGDLGCADE